MWRVYERAGEALLSPFFLFSFSTPKPKIHPHTTPTHAHTHAHPHCHPLCYLRLQYAQDHGIKFWSFCNYPIGCKDHHPPASACPGIQCTYICCCSSLFPQFPGFDTNQREKNVEVEGGESSTMPLIRGLSGREGVAGGASGLLGRCWVVT